MVGVLSGAGRWGLIGTELHGARPLPSLSSFSRGRLLTTGVQKEDSPSCFERSVLQVFAHAKRRLRDAKVAEVGWWSGWEGVVWYWLLCPLVAPHARFSIPSSQPQRPQHDTPHHSGFLTFPEYTGSSTTPVCSATR